MANQLFQGYLFDDAGVPVVGATANLYTRDTTTPVLATTTTDANGRWTISYATEGMYDVEIVSGSSKRRRKWFDQVQLDTIDVAKLRVRNPAGTFDYDIVSAAIVADRQLNLPLIAATQTLLDNSRGLTLAGENNTEATSTSTSAGDRVTVTGLSIPATSVVIIVAAVRKTAGAATWAGFGLKVNTTIVQEATGSQPYTSQADEAQSGVVIWILGPRVTNYLGVGVVLSGIRGATGFSTGTMSMLTADIPNATITDIIIRGISNNVAITHGIDEVRVFALPTVAP